MARPFNSAKLSHKFSTLTNTKESIQALSVWIMDHHGYMEEIVGEWLLGICKDCDALSMFYVANDIIQKCGKKRCAEFRQEFASAIEKVAGLQKVKDKRDNIHRLLVIWKEREIYDEEFCARVKEKLFNADVSKETDVLVFGDSEPTESEIIENFKLQDFIGNVKKLTLLERKIEEKEEVLKLVDEPQASDIEYTIVHGNLKEMIKKSETFISFVEESIKLAHKEILSRKKLMKDIHGCNVFYQAQSRDVKAVAQAYTLYGKRVKKMEERVLEKLSAFTPVEPPESDLIPLSYENVDSYRHQKRENSHRLVSDWLESDSPSSTVGTTSVATPISNAESSINATPNSSFVAKETPDPVFEMLEKPTGAREPSMIPGLDSMEKQDTNANSAEDLASDLSSSAIPDAKDSTSVLKDVSHGFESTDDSFIGGGCFTSDFSALISSIDVASLTSTLSFFNKTTLGQDGDGEKNCPETVGGIELEVDHPKPEMNETVQQIKEDDKVASPEAEKSSGAEENVLDVNNLLEKSFEKTKDTYKRKIDRLLSNKKRKLSEDNEKTQTDNESKNNSSVVSDFSTTNSETQDSIQEIGSAVQLNQDAIQAVENSCDAVLVSGRLQKPKDLELEDSVSSKDNESDCLLKSQKTSPTFNSNTKLEKDSTNLGTNSSGNLCDIKDLDAREKRVSVESNSLDKQQIPNLLDTLHSTLRCITQYQYSSDNFNRSFLDYSEKCEPCIPIESMLQIYSMFKSCNSKKCGKNNGVELTVSSNNSAPCEQITATEDNFEIMDMDCDSE